LSLGKVRSVNPSGAIGMKPVTGSILLDVAPRLAEAGTAGGFGTAASRAGTAYIMTEVRG